MIGNRSVAGAWKNVAAVYVVASACAVAQCPAMGASREAVPNFAPAGDIGWLANSLMLTPSPTGPQPVTVDPTIFDAAHPFDVLHNFPILDLKNPNLQGWVVDALRAQNERVRSGKPLHLRSSACWPNGLPAMFQQTVNPIFFVQATDEVTMIWQQNTELRHIHLNQRHSARPKASWFGESVGHYENGDTLVIDTIGLNDRTFLDFFHTPHSPDLHLIERWKPVDDGRSLEVKVRVEDPGAFKAPYEVTQLFRRSDRPWLEYVCAENNNDVLGEGFEPMPQTTAPDF